MIKLKNKFDKMRHETDTFSIGWVIHKEDVLYKSSVISIEQRSAIIESIMLGISPRLAYFRNQEDKMEIIFGDEIIDTIIKFVDNGFQLTNMKFLVELNGLNFNDIKHIDLYSSWTTKSHHFIETQLYSYKFKSNNFTPDEINKILRLMTGGL